MTRADEFYISLRGITKSFGPVKAVDNVSIDIRRGEFFSLLGPSGCGKTTLLRMIAGFEFPSAGEIFIDGQPMSAVPPNRRPTNMVFQSYAIFPHLTVAENIAYGLRKKSLTKLEIDTAVERALEQIKLAQYGKRAAHQLSGGQRQRVALARALVCRPKVLLLDEPLGALDKRLREQMQVELRELQRSVGITFVLVTHDQEEALALSDRIAVMSGGKDLQIDSPAELYDNPNCREVADFIGSMNFFDGVVQQLEQDNAIVDIGLSSSLRVSLRRPGMTPGKPVTVAVRPEKIRLRREKPSDAENAMLGHLNSSVFFGDRSHHFVEVPKLPNRVAVAAQSLQGSWPSRVDDRENDVWLAWSPQSAILLPRDEPSIP
jgi:spermidine/putrescine ABC transporter ATP-binding subunit